MFLVGELSKFPLPYDGWGGKCFSSFARGGCRVSAAEPRASGSRRKRRLRRPPARALSVLAPGELVTQAPTFEHVPPPPRTAGRGFSQTTEGELPSWSYPFASYLLSQLKGQDLRLGALARPTVRVPHRERRGRAPGVWHFPPWCPALAGTHLPAAVHRGQNGISRSSPLPEFTSVATNFQSLPLSW